MTESREKTTSESKSTKNRSGSKTSSKSKINSQSSGSKISKHAARPKSDKHSSKPKLAKQSSGSKNSKNASRPNVLPKTDIRNICFEKINDEYSWAKYGDFKVIMMIKNGYINATNLCNDTETKNGAKKEFKRWKNNSYAKELMEEIADDQNRSSDFSTASGKKSSEDLLIPITSGSKNLTLIRGTYAHPDLIPHIASWASPSFAVKVSKIVKGYLIKQAIKEKNKTIQKQKDKIDDLTDKIDEVLTNNKELLTNNKEQSSTIDKMNNRVKMLLKKNDEMYDQNEDILGKIDTISNERVVSTGNSNHDHMFVVIKNNDDPEIYDEDDEIYEYHALRVMKRNYNRGITQHKNRHPEMEILMNITYSPNSINLWTRIKDSLGTGRNKKIKFNNSKFNLRAKYTEQKLIKDINDIHNERYNCQND